MDQQEFARKIQEKSNLELQRLKIMFEDLFYVSNGEKKLKPNVTMGQLYSIKDSLIKALAIYNERNKEEDELEEADQEFDNKINQTKNKLIDFSKQYNVEIPNVLSKLYGI